MHQHNKCTVSVWLWFWLLIRKHPSKCHQVQASDLIPARFAHCSEKFYHHVCCWHRCRCFSVLHVLLLVPVSCPVLFVRSLFVSVFRFCFSPFWELFANLGVASVIENATRILFQGWGIFYPVLCFCVAHSTLKHCCTPPPLCDPVISPAAARSSARNSAVLLLPFSFSNSPPASVKQCWSL